MSEWNRVNTICVLWVVGGVSWLNTTCNSSCTTSLSTALIPVLFLVEHEHLLSIEVVANGYISVAEHEKVA